MSLGIKKGDLVEVVSGSYKYNVPAKKRGKVRSVLTNKNRIIVDNINMMYKHLKPSNMNPKGGRIEKESPIHASNIMLVCPSCDKTTRIKARVRDDGRKVRYCMRCDKDVDE